MQERDEEIARLDAAEARAEGYLRKWMDNPQYRAALRELAAAGNRPELAVVGR